MLNIGNKTYRNLQEQVAYNTECIKKLDEYLDGVTIEDKLVIIANDSGTFTDDELTILSGALAFIADGDKVWIKEGETLTELVYKAIDVVATEISSTYFNIGGSKIVINKTTGAYATSSDSIINVYDKDQIESIITNINSTKADKTELLDKANLSGANFTGSITAPSIIENMSGYSFVEQTSTKATYEYVFAGVVKNGNKLTFVLDMNITRTDDFTGAIVIGVFSIPYSLQSKLIPTTIGSYDLLDLKSAQISKDGVNLKSVSCQVTKNVTDVIIRFTGSGVLNTNFTLNEKYNTRLEFTFLLSENLAS